MVFCFKLNGFFVGLVVRIYENVLFFGLVIVKLWSLCFKILFFSICIVIGNLVIIGGLFCVMFMYNIVLVDFFVLLV